MTDEIKRNGYLLREETFTAKGMTVTRSRNSYGQVAITAKIDFGGDDFITFKFDTPDYVDKVQTLAKLLEEAAYESCALPQQPY